MLILHAMKLAIKHITISFFLVLMSFQILNLSIDSIEFQPLQSASSIGDFNYLNSMTEYVAEIILNQKDAFPEFQKKSSKESQVLKHIDIKLFQPSSVIIVSQHFNSINSFIIPLKESYFFLFSKEINPPPVWS